MVITNPPTEKKELSYIPYAQKGTVKPKTDLTAPYGTYNIKTGVYTSPEGVSSSTRTIPSGAKIIYDGPSGSGGGTTGGGGATTSQTTPSMTSQTLSTPQQQNLNTYSQKIQNYYASQIVKGVTYTPEKLKALQQSGILQYSSTQFKKGEGLRITPQGEVFKTQQNINAGLFGGVSVSPASPPLAFKEVDILGSLFPEFRNKGKRGTVSQYIEERYIAGIEKSYKYFPAGETRSLLFGTATIGDTSISSPRVTDTLKFAFFSPYMITGQQQYIYNVGKGVIIQEPKTSFISEITPLKKDFKVVTISDTESEGITLSSLSKQIVRGGDKTSIGKGGGFTTNFNKPNILQESKLFKVYSFNEEIGGFKDIRIVKGLSITEDTLTNVKSIIPKSTYNAYSLTKPKQIRISQSLGFVGPTDQENLFGYVGTTTGNKFNIQGLIRINQPRDFIESSLIKSKSLGLGKKTPLIFSNPLGDLQRTQIKNIVTSRALEKSSSISSFRGAIFSSGGGLETRQRLNLSFSNAQTSRQALSQRSLLKSSFAQPSKLRFSLASSQIQAPSQAQRLRLGSLNVIKLKTIYKNPAPPIVPRFTTYKTRIPKLSLNISSPKKSPNIKPKKNYLSSAKLITIAPSRKFLGINGGIKI